MLEPYVLKGTRTVLRRGETSNCLFLFDLISPPHPHKKNIDTNPLNVQFIPGLKKPENSCTIKLKKVKIPKGIALINLIIIKSNELSCQ